MINLNDRGAELEGTTLIHPDGFDDLREALQENLKPFREKDLEDLKRKGISKAGLTQILTMLATKCDQIWEKLASNEESGFDNLSETLTEIFADRDTASLLGDFAFSIMPKIVQTDKLAKTELEEIALQLKQLVWKLEDAIIQTSPSEEFIRRFIFEKFA